MNRDIEILILKYKNPFINSLDQYCFEIEVMSRDKNYFLGINLRNETLIWKLLG